MAAELYYRVHQNDGRVENYHLSVHNMSILSMLMQDIRRPGLVEKIMCISMREFEKDSPEQIQTVTIHTDKHVPGDGQGEQVGLIEHYLLSWQSDGDIEDNDDDY